MTSFPTAGALSSMRAGWPLSAPAPGLERCLLLSPGTALLSGTPAGDLNGTLQHAKGALAGETLAVGRAVIVPGAQCSLVDAATVMLAVLKAIDASVDIGVPELSCALVRYNEELLMPGRTPGPDEPRLPGVFPAWRVGLQLTLPLEFSPTTQRWVANVSQLKAWGAEYVSWQIPAYYTLAQPLDTPQDALAYRDAIAAQVPTTGALAPLATALRGRLLANACEAVLDLVHLLRAVREKRPADLRGFLLDLAAPLKPHQAKVLAGVSGGHAVLRALWRELAALDPAALSSTDRNRLLAVRRVVADDGLGLRAKTGVTDAWDGPQEIGPRAQAAEPPMGPALEKILDSEKKDGTQVPRVAQYLEGVVLGRSVRISKPLDNTKNPWGYVASHPGSGSFHPVAYLKTEGSRVPGLIGGLTLSGAATLESGPMDEPRMMARMLLAGRIAAIEGTLDAVSAGDPGIISMGMQQWAAAFDTELTVLLERFRVQAPDLFDLYIGMWGLQTARWHPPLDKGKVPADDAARHRLIDVANPFGPDPAGLTSAEQRMGYFPQHVSFFVVKPQEAPAVLPAPPAPKVPGPRRSYFLDDGSARDWCARFRLAELLSPELCRVQLHQAAWRFTRVASQDFAHPNTGRTQFAMLKFKFVYPAKPAKDLKDNEFNLCFEGAAPSVSLSLEHSIAELLPSELAAAAALDVHINSSSHFIPHLRKALRSVRGPTHRQVGTGSTSWQLDPDYLRRLAINYVGSRGVVNANAYRTQELLSLYEVRKADACAAIDTDRALTLEVPPPGPPPTGRFPW